MCKIRPGPDPKAALVSEICSLSRSPISCIHINGNSGSCFIDWYLILGAYLCLTDETERRCFNTERRKNVCLKCSRLSHKTKENRTETKQNRFCQTLRDIRDTFREENKVIKRCLKTNSARFMGSLTEETPVFGIPNPNRFNMELPVFNPSDYKFCGYPHVRNRVLDNNLSDCKVFMRSRSTCVHSSLCIRSPDTR
ncbi:uncharacterized protein LOC108863120 isoform X2 [Raphanus sativus]|uniref:Uncharacterized protein LOC108863120 isoform X2 n=1 Tax=Raphanus sativus TaxID=3726 RepID=A0A6J0P8D4_RAPSA|nr:uncharacterized protein LOC108863120 isoform X2 [Raphanus sativus]